MAKHIIYDEKDARARVLAGINAVVNTVGKTLGPKGQNIVLKRELQFPLITNDGVTIAREIDLEDEFEDLGAQLVKEAALKTNDIAGDGTTTAVVLAEAIIKSGIERIDAGANPMEVRKEIEADTLKIIEALKAQANKIDTKEELSSVATISAGDAAIGDLVASVVFETGPDGAITLEPSETPNSYSEKIDGIKINQGNLSPYFITDYARSETTLEKPAVIVCNDMIAHAPHLMPVLKMLMAAKKNDVLIIADSIENSALQVLNINAMEGRFRIVAIKAPFVGTPRKEFMEDICAVTGATLISSELSRPINEVTIDMVGSAKKVVATMRDTVIVSELGETEEVKERISDIKERVSKLPAGSFEKHQLTERLARLTNGVATIKIGGYTEVEREEKIMRVEDAREACKAALEDGIVVGGGMALVEASKAVSADSVMFAPCFAPFGRIVSNAGLNPTEKADEYKDRKGFAFDPISEKWVNASETGIIDPVKVTITALTNAASVAQTVLTLGGLVSYQTDGQKVIL